MREITQDELDEILKKHKAWLEPDEKGEMADLRRTDLRRLANLNYADLSGADLSGADLSGADLSGTSFSYANLQNAVFRGATLLNVSLGEADLTEADLTAIEIDRKTAAQIPNVLREKYEGSWIILKDKPVERSIKAESMSDLREITQNELDEILKKHEAWLESDRKEGEMADLSGASLIGADLSGANLSDANLSNANLSNANINDANISFADLSRAILSDADLSRANLSGAILTSANLSGASLLNADFNGTNIFFTNLQKADFRGATLLKVYLKGADFTGADLTAIHIDTETAVQIADALREKYQHTWIFLKDESVIERSIEFPPGCHEAGMGILSYFGTVVRQKYKDIKVGVTIKQDGQKVTMIVETPEGEQEKIEKTLEEYGLVVTGNMKPEEFLSNPIEVMELKQKLEITHTELKLRKELSEFKDKQYGERIESLENQLQKLHNCIGGVLQHSEKTAQVQSDNAQIYQDFISLLEKHASKADIQEIKMLMASAQEKKPEAFPKVLRKVLFIAGQVAIGAGGSGTWDGIKTAFKKLLGM